MNIEEKSMDFANKFLNNFSMTTMEIYDATRKAYIAGAVDAFNADRPITKWNIISKVGNPKTSGLYIVQMIGINGETIICVKRYERDWWSTMQNDVVAWTDIKYPIESMDQSILELRQERILEFQKLERKDDVK